MKLTQQLVDLPMPSPDLSPGEVVKIQLKALQHNNDQDNGIAITFNFASPGNKAFTGPLDRFKLLVKNPAYEPMLNFQSYRAGKMMIQGRQAQQAVIITDQDGNQAAYVFTLSKQTNSPYQGCWMTDSVLRVEMEPLKEI